MRRSISRHVPVLTHAAPFAVAPSKHSGAYIAYTLRGQRGFFATGLWSLISGLIFTPLFMWEIIRSGAISTIRVAFIPLPVFLLPFFGLALIAIGIVLLRKSAHDRQVVIDRDTRAAQIQDDRGYASPTAPGSLCVHSLDLLLAKGKQAAHIGPDQIFATIIRVGNDFEILGAFKYEASANTFAQTLAEETGLDIDTSTEFLYTTVHGFWDLNPTNNDPHALAHRNQDRHIEPVAFRGPNVASAPSP